MKKQDVLEPTPASPLLRHFSLVCAPLLEHLAPRDVVLLFSSCRAFRGDHAAAGTALQSHASACHFFQGCMRDWCKTTPTLSFNYACDASSSHAANPWDNGSLLPSKRIALLSLASLMATRLQDAIYSTKTGYVNAWQVVPFTLPLDIRGNGSERDVRTALEAVNPVLAAAFLSGHPSHCSEPGLHWQNLEVLDDNGTVVCNFCEMTAQETERFIAGGVHYWDERDRMHVDHLGTSDHEEDDDSEREEPMQSLQESDAYYDRQLLHDALRSDIVSHLFRHDELPLLQLMQPKTSRVIECVEAASAQGYYKDVCSNVYRPLCQLFHHNGFRHVSRWRTMLFSPSEELPRSEINSVEMIGGLAPHGFLAGVYLVEIFT